LNLFKALAHVARLAIGNSEYWASTLDQADQDCDHCQNQQNMNKSTQRVRADHAQQPENQEHTAIVQSIRIPFTEAVYVRINWLGVYEYWSVAGIQ
jgi:hypothetical protein